MSSDGIAALFAGTSLLLAAYVFWRDSQIRQFELSTRLSEEIEQKWHDLLGITGTDDEYCDALVIVLNHYERCATLLNDMVFFKSRAMKALEIQIVEALKRNWDEPLVQTTFRKACSSEQTYCEIRALMARSNGFAPDKA